LIHEAKPGVENARNAGFAASRADIIGRIDVDTRVKPGWARAAREFTTEHPEVVGCSGYTVYYDLPWRRLTGFFSWLSVFLINEVLGGNYSFYGANMAIRRSVWEKIKHDVKTEKDGAIMEDLSVSIAASNAGYEVGWAKDMVADVSGRRIRTSPLAYARYASRWWRTYWVYGRRGQAWLTRILGCGIGDVVVGLYSTIIRFHDPVTMKWSLKNWRKGLGGATFAQINPRHPRRSYNSCRRPSRNLFRSSPCQISFAFGLDRLRPQRQPVTYR
jgi:glycosyltransferase involved in cell wall biosynthesis